MLQLTPSLTVFAARLSLVRRLYTTFKDDLIRTRSELRAWSNRVGLRQGTMDVEAELVYLRLRALKPTKVCELGFGQGLMTEWILRALRDNDHGHLYTFDKFDSNNRAKDVPGELAQRWTFTKGDARVTAPKHMPYEYIHSDCEHSVKFTEWLTREHLVAYTTPVRVSFHDVFLNVSSTTSMWKSDPSQCGTDKKCRKDLSASQGGTSPEGLTLLKWLASAARANRVPYAFTVARSHFPGEFERIMAARSRAGLDEQWIAPLCSGGKNRDGLCRAFDEKDPGVQPSVYFLACTGRFEWRACA